MSDGSSRDNCQGRSTPTSDERVRLAARTLRKPRTAAWIADETGVSKKTVQKTLNQLVKDGILQQIKQDEQTLYHTDQLLALYREVAELQRKYDYGELTAALESMRSQVAMWKEAYEVETPSELRETIVDLKHTDKVDQRREIVSEWEQIDDRISIVETAVRNYEWAVEQDNTSHGPSKRGRYY